MNCQPGDLALVLRGSFNCGRFVTCVRLEQPQNIVLHESGPVWLIDTTLRWFTRGPVDGPAFVQLPYAPDRVLLPIRPLPDEEVLQAEAIEA
jgi:hypothetical protein